MWCFVIGVLFSCLGLVSWKDMDKEGRIFLLFITLFAFTMSFVWSWLSRRGQRKRRRMAEPEPTRRNPIAKLPPLRE